MRKTFFVFTLLILLSNLLFSQERWIPDPRTTPKTPTGKYIPLPYNAIRWENPNTDTRIIITPMGTMAVGPSFRVLPNSNQQDEIVLVRHPINQLIMFGSANTTVGSAYAQGCYVTTNGGLNWYGTDILPGLPNSTSDPAPAIDKDGRFIFTTLNTTGTATMISNYSTNNGVNWTNYITITSQSSDKNFAASDDAPTSPYYGRTYAVWSNFALSAPPIVVAYTTNGAVSWSGVIQINTPPSGHYSQGCDIAIGPTGQVYVVWAAPLSSGSYTEDFAGFGRSTNGGVTWTVNENIYDMNGIRASSFNGWGVRVNGFTRIGVDRSGGPRNGWIYVVAAEQNLAPAGSDADVILHRSSDGGVTWSAGIRVNQDALNNGKKQFFPAVRVDEYGGVNVVYYDNRDFPSVGDSCNTYLSRSIDGGNTWTDMKVSDHAWKPKPEPGAGTYMGDYIGITSGNNKVWPFWFDDKSGTFQAWTCAVDLGPSINHTALTNTEQTTGTRPVNAQIIPAGSGINPSTVKLYYSKDNPSITNNVAMTNSGGNNWIANLPLSGAGLYRYYLTATDSLSRTATSPAGAPSNFHSFTASSDTVKPVITHSPLGNTPKTQWPATVLASATDNIGIDSVWVRWYKNNTSTGIKHFKLLPAGGNNYSAAFNSDTSQVAYNDSIFYRVFARDNSSNHNTDSTALYNFKIVAIANACVGTGTTAVGWPFYTFYMDSRTDMLYLASELIGGGGAPGSITKIGFNVVSAASQTMNGFQIKMQQTSSPSISGFTSSGWTTVYNGSYSVQGAGWQYINLQTPFVWNGTSNLLIEICYNNSSYTSNTTVNASTASGRVAHGHSDLTSGDGCVQITTPGSTYTALPNICMEISLITGEQKFVSNVPTIYSLNQNYPNPFNPVTKINFAVPKQGLLTLKVYDVLGREVRTLVNEVKSAGIYTIDFDGTELSSGVYFYRMEVNGFSDVKRMILVK